MPSIFLFLGGLSALTGVGMGAFGAHALKKLLSADMLSVYQTGVTYQMWHALGLISIAFIYQGNLGSKLLNWAGWLMFIGIILFSGSLYLLALTQTPWLGMVTPFGGVSFIMAWLFVCVFAAKSPSSLRVRPY